VTVLNVFMGQPKPGRYDDVVEMSRTANKVIERHGGKNMRTVVATVSTATYGNVVNICEFEDLEAWGGWLDAVLVDEEILAVLGQLRSESSPYLTQSTGVVVEVPLGRQVGANGPVIASFMSAPVPGRYQDAVGLSGRAFELFERHGARNCRLFAQQANGIQPETLISSVEFDSIKACAKTLDLMTSDPEGRSIIELVQSPDSPTRTLSTDIYTEIPT
jgi:hypothetical protein